MSETLELKGEVRKYVPLDLGTKGRAWNNSGEFVTLHCYRVAVCFEFTLLMWPQKALYVGCDLLWFQAGHPLDNWQKQMPSGETQATNKYKWKVAMK